MKKILFLIIIVTSLAIPKTLFANEIIHYTTQIAAIDPGGDDFNLDIINGPTNEDFDKLNPLKITKSPVADQLSTPGGIVTRLLDFLFPLTGLILFLLIAWGGFEILFNSADQKGIEAGKNRITAAIIGFILLFASYWLVQILEIIFGITIL